MADESLESLIDLLQEASVNGIKIHFDGQLRVRIPKDSVMSPHLLERIRLKKEELSNYLMKPQKVPQSAESALGLKVGDATYFEISSVQQWWVDDEIEIDFKRKLFFADYLHVRGEFDPDIFKETVDHLLNRHESLRTVYQKMEQGFMMKILKKPVEFFYTYIDDDKIDSSEIDNLFFFGDHDFDVKSGPLFIVRLIKRSHQEFLLSFKGHHSIFDGWSIDVLFRDLKMIYAALSDKREIRFEPLIWQYKDYVRLINEFQTKHKENHRAYWNALYQNTPPPLVIRGENSSSVNHQNPSVCKYILFDLLPGAYQTVTSIGAKHNTSQFVVLQATIFHFLQLITGQDDIILGTQFFGRTNLPFDIEQQIGCYVQTTLIRTILTENDSFDTCVLKVKKANEDVHTYTAYTLLDWLQENLEPTQKLHSIWKISVHYHDNNGFVQQETAGGRFSISKVVVDESGIINMSMKLEFFKVEHDLKLRITYDASTFSVDGINSFANDYTLYLQRLIAQNH
jgi:hypothetical protein